MAYCILYTRLSTREAPGAIPNDSVTILGRFWSDSGAIPNRFCVSGAMWTQEAKSMKINKNIDRRIGRNANFQKKSIDVLDGMRSRRFFIDIYCSEFQKWRFCRRVAKAGSTKHCKKHAIITRVSVCRRLAAIQVVGHWPFF